MSIDTTTYSSIERVTTTPGGDQPGGTSTVVIAAAVCGGIIGVIVIIIICVCAWCITRQVSIQISCIKKGQKSDTRKQQQQLQQQDGSNTISIQQNEAYRHLPHSREPTVYQTITDIPEQALQSNLAYGLQGEMCEGIETEETGDEYERMYVANCHAKFGPNARELQKCSNMVKPREYDLPFRRQERNIYIEDTEHPYEYII